MTRMIRMIRHRRNLVRSGYFLVDGQVEGFSEHMAPEFRCVAPEAFARLTRLVPELAAKHIAQAAP